MSMHQWKGVLFGALFLLGGCVGSKAVGVKDTENSDLSKAEIAEMPASPVSSETESRQASSAASAAHAAPTALPFIEDDYILARKKALEIGKPLFVEVWAPW